MADEDLMTFLSTIGKEVTEKQIEEEKSKSIVLDDEDGHSSLAERTEDTPPQTDSLEPREQSKKDLHKHLTLTGDNGKAQDHKRGPNEKKGIKITINSESGLRYDRLRKIAFCSLQHFMNSPFVSFRLYVILLFYPREILQIFE